MSWEQAPGPARARRWLLPAGMVVVVIVVVAGVLTGRDRSPGTLAVGPTDVPDISAPASMAPVDPADFERDRLAPLKVTRDIEGTGPLLPDAPDLTVIVSDDLGLQIVDVATGDVRRLEIIVSAPAALSETLFIVGDSVIVGANGDVVRVINGMRRPLRIADEHRAIRTLGNGSVWVFDDFSSVASGTASRVRFDGTVADQVQLPAVARPVVGTADGLVVGAPGIVAFIASDGSRRAIAAGDPIASDGERVAWLDCPPSLVCSVVIGTLDDPDQVRLPLAASDLPAGFFGLPAGAFSPDGRWLALPLYRDRGSDGVERARISIVDTVTGTEVRRLTGSSVNPFNSPLAWSPDSRWLLLGSASGLSAWDTRTRTVTELDIDLLPPRALAVR